MIALAILCLVVAAAIVALMATVGFTASVSFATFAGNVQTRPFWVFVLGAGTLLLALLGLSLLHRGTRRKVQRRREVKRLRKLEQESSRSTTGSTGSRGTSGDAGAPGSGDAPDRTLVRERPVDVRTPPSGTVGASPTGEDPRSGPRQHPS